MRLEQKIEKDQVPKEKNIAMPGAINDLEQRKAAFKGRMTSNSFHERKSGTFGRKSSGSYQNSNLTAEKQSAVQKRVIEPVCETKEVQAEECCNLEDSAPSKDVTSTTVTNAPTKTEEVPGGEVADKSNPTPKSPMLTKRSPRMTGLSLSKLSVNTSKSPIDGKEGDSESNKADEEPNSGLMNVSIKEMLQNKKKILLKPKTNDPKPDAVSSATENPTKTHPPENKSLEKATSAVLPKIKELSDRKSGFAKALEESQAKFGMSRRDLGAKFEGEMSRIEAMIAGTPKLAQMFGRATPEQRKEEPVQVGGIVMKAIPREMTPKITKGKIELNAIRASPYAQKAASDLKSSPLLMPSQLRAELSETGLIASKQALKGGFLNKMNGFDLIRDKMLHPESSEKSGTIHARSLLSKFESSINQTKQPGNENSSRSDVRASPALNSIRDNLRSMVSPATGKSADPSAIDTSSVNSNKQNDGTTTTSTNPNKLAESKETSSKAQKPVRTPNLTLRSLAKFDEVAQKVKEPSHQSASIDTNTIADKINDLPTKSSVAESKDQPKDENQTSLEASKNDSNVNDGSASPSKKESPKKGKLPDPSLIYSSKGKTTKKKLLTKQKTMNFNIKKEKPISKENVEEESKEPPKLNLNIEDKGTPAENKIESSQDKTNQNGEGFEEDPTEGIMVRSYSEGALKKFRALPNKG